MRAMGSCARQENHYNAHDHVSEEEDMPFTFSQLVVWLVVGVLAGSLVSLIVTGSREARPLTGSVSA